MNKKYLSHLFEAIKQTTGMVEKNKNQPNLPGINKEMTIKSGYHDLYDQLKKNNLDILKNLNKGKVERQRALDRIDNISSPSLFPVLHKKRAVELEKDLKLILNGIKNVETETEYRDNLRMVLNRFFTTGKGIAKRYILLPLSSNFNINQINDINNSLNREQGLLSKMSDFNEIVIDDRVDNQLINYLINCGYSVDKDEFYKGFCRNDKNIKLKIMDELEKIKKINLTDKKNFLKRLKPDDPLYPNVQQQITNRERFKDSYLERMSIILSDSHQPNTDDVNVVVITWIPRLIMSQSTNTIWTSCMELFSDTREGGSNQRFVMSGIKAGVFIAWLVNLKDAKTMSKPIARMLIKPFYSEGDDDVVFWPSDLYHDGGTANLSTFVRTVNHFCYIKQQNRINFKRDVRMNIMEPYKVYADSGDRDKVVYSFQSLLDRLMDNDEYEKQSGEYNTQLVFTDENDNNQYLDIDINSTNEDDNFFQILMHSNGYSDQKFLDFLKDSESRFLKRHGYLIFAAALKNSKYVIIDFILKENKKDLDRYFYKSFLKFFMRKANTKTVSYNLLVFLFNNYIFKYKLYMGEHDNEYRTLFRALLIDKRLDMVAFLLKNRDFFLSYINESGLTFLDLIEDQNIKKTVLDFLINKANEREIASFKIKRKLKDYYRNDIYALSAFKYSINDKAKVAKIDEIFFAKENGVKFKLDFLEMIYSNKMSDVSYRQVFNEKLFMQALSYFTELEGKIKVDDYEGLRHDLITVLTYDNVNKYLSENDKQTISTQLLHMDKLVTLKLQNEEDFNSNKVERINKRMYEIGFVIDKYLDFLVEKKHYSVIIEFIEMVIEEHNNFKLFHDLIKRYAQYLPKDNFKIRQRQGTTNFLFLFLSRIFYAKVNENFNSKILRDTLTFMSDNGFVLNGEEQYHELLKDMFSGNLEEINKKYGKIYFAVDFILEQIEKNKIKITEIGSWVLTRLISHRLTDSNKKIYDYFGRFINLIGPELIFKNTARWINEAAPFFIPDVIGNEFYFRRLLEYNPKFFEEEKNIEVIVKKITDYNSVFESNFVTNKITKFFANGFMAFLKKQNELPDKYYKNFYKFIIQFPETITSVNQKNLADSEIMQVFYHVIKKEKFADYDINEITKELVKILVNKNLLTETNLDQIYDHIGNAYVYLLDDHFDEKFMTKNFKLKISKYAEIEDTANNMVVLRNYMENLQKSKIRQPTIHMKKFVEMYLEITQALDENNSKYAEKERDRKMLNEIIRNILICIRYVLYAIRDNKDTDMVRDESKNEFLKVINSIQNKNLRLSSRNIDTINEMKWMLNK